MANRMLALIAVFLLAGPAVAEAQGTLTVRVLADLSTFDTIPAAGGGLAFHVAGTLCSDPTIEAACAPIGDFHCWGWISALGTVVVNQEYNFDGRGKVLVAGVEDPGPRAVVGGTGDFSNVRGEATGFLGLGEGEFPDPPEFVATFKLVGARN